MLVYACDSAKHVSRKKNKIRKKVTANRTINVVVETKCASAILQKVCIDIAYPYGVVLVTCESLHVHLDASE